MLTTITYGEQVVRPKQTSSGLYATFYRVCEMTGRVGLKDVTVVPEHVWEKPNSPYYTSFQLPAESLLTLDDWLQIDAKLHPAMAL